MDKFGIFNLLNSFFPMTSQKSEATLNNTTVSGDLLSNLLSSLTKGVDDKKNLQPEIKKSTNNAPHPLQEQMLLTLSSHDAFVKRVKEKQKSF